jgi:3-hydroxyacyl-CoA dehydrogenase
MEGAMPWDIDRVLYDFGLPMGPFAMSDLAGLDIGWDSDQVEARDRIRDVLCEADRRGQKTGAGYYDYDENRNAKPSADHREGHRRLRRQKRQTRARSATRRSWSGASIR